jgi:hypothetical protein
MPPVLNPWSVFGIMVENDLILNRGLAFFCSAADIEVAKQQMGRRYAYIMELIR